MFGACWSAYHVVVSILCTNYNLWCSWNAEEHSNYNTIWIKVQGLAWLLLESYWEICIELYQEICSSLKTLLLVSSCLSQANFCRTNYSLYSCAASFLSEIHSVCTVHRTLYLYVQNMYQTLGELWSFYVHKMCLKNDGEFWTFLCLYNVSGECMKYLVSEEKWQHNWKVEQLVLQKLTCNRQVDLIKGLSWGNISWAFYFGQTFSAIVSGHFS